MQLIAIGLNHSTAPVDIRERFSFSQERIRCALQEAQSWDGIREAVLLSTCNRTELYAVARDEDTVRECLLCLAGCAEEAGQHFLFYVGEACMRHLLRVASSLESLVLGEGQILSQVKEAYALARECGSTGTQLNLLFHRALATGKRVRSETYIAYHSVSISYAAVELAKESMGGIEGHTALLIGAGKMARLTAQHLMSAGVKKLYVANRHLEHAQELAGSIGAEAIPLSDVLSRYADVDIVVSSTSAPHYIVKREQMRKAMELREGRPVFVIDIAVPRDVEPEIGLLDGVTLYNIDDLRSVVDKHLQERQREAVQAERIVEEEVTGLCEKLKYLSVRPVMERLSKRAEEIRLREMKREGSKLSGLNENEWRHVNRMTQRIVRKLLRMPMMELRISAGTEEELSYMQALQELFDLNWMGSAQGEKESNRDRDEKQQAGALAGRLCGGLSQEKISETFGRKKADDHEGGQDS